MILNDSCVKKIFLKVNNGIIFKLAVWGLMIWLFLALFVGPGEVQKSLKIVAFVLVLNSVVLKAYLDNMHIQISQQKFLLVMMVISVFVLNIFVSRYSHLYFVKTFGFLLLLYFMFADSNSYNNMPWHFINKCFYWIMLFGVVFSILSLDSINKDVSFSAIGDKNYTGILMFLFFIYSYKFKKNLGMLVCIIFLIFMSASRSLYGLFTLFFVFKFLKCKINYLRKNMFLNRFWKIFVMIFVFICIISGFWISYIAVNPLSQYREGFNDSSNKMRFAANIYALDRINNDASLLFIGYGDDLKKELGISDDVNIKQHTKYMNERLVQPHNSILNLFLRIGIIPAVIYFLILSYILDKLSTVNNCEYIFPYLINTIFMHSLLSGVWLGLWILILFFVNDYDRRYLKYHELTK